MNRNIVVPTITVLYALEAYLRSMSLIDDNETINDIREQAQTYAIEIKKE